MTTSTTAGTPTTDDLTAALQNLADRAVRGRHTGGLLLGVESDDGATSAHVAAGDVATDAPYFIASITKMFTAAVTFQLIDEGRLAINDRVVHLLADLDLAGLHVHRGIDSTSELQLHHLLHQTSGLGDYFDGNYEDRLSAGEDLAYSIQDTVDIARRAGAVFPLGDRDGRRSSYSDVNWQLLTGVVEAATGRCYGDVVRERIVEPLGLRGTYAFPGGDNRPDPLPLRRRDQVLSIPDALTSERGAGGIVSTLDDQLRFSRAFHAGELFAGGIGRAGNQWNRVLNFMIGYGHGVMRFQLPRWMTGRRTPAMFGHSGSTASFLFHIPDRGVHVAGTFNQFADPARPFRLLPQVVRTLDATSGAR